MIMTEPTPTRSPVFYNAGDMAPSSTSGRFVKFGGEDLDFDDVAQGAVRIFEATYEDRRAKQFHRLVDQWIDDTLDMSSVKDMVVHPAYLRIIAMGDWVIALLLRELEERPNYWFVALRSITEDDPIPDNANGDFTMMVDAWLEWGRREGYC